VESPKGQIISFPSIIIGLNIQGSVHDDVTEVMVPVP
jgi:hypothetical protein